jgi:hypothetical protein
MDESSHTLHITVHVWQNIMKYVCQNNLNDDTFITIYTA